MLSFTSKSRFVIAGGVALLALTIIAYAGVLQNDFVKFDDDVYVVNNPYTAAGLSRGGFRYAFTTFDSGNWIPLTFLSYQLDVTLFGFRPAAFHAVNLALHALNGLLLFAWLVRVTGAHWRSFVVAALFAVHPLHVESVAWVAERKDVLSAFWLLVALFAYERYAVHTTARWYLATCVAFVLGLLSKSMLVTLPVLLLLIDVWPLERWARAGQTGQGQPGAVAGRYPRRTTRALLLEKLPLMALAFVDGMVTIVAQGSGETTAIMSMAKLPLYLRIGNSLAAYGWYVARTVWPTGLSVIYVHPLRDLPWGRVALAALLLAAISASVGRHGFRRPHLLFGWLWFLMALLPVIGLVQVGTQAYADRYSYIPHFGLIVLIVWEGGYWLGASPGGRRAAGVFVALATAACAWLTISQVTVWRTADTLFAHALAVNPKNWYAHLLVGDICLRNGREDEARAHFQSVLKYYPRHSDALNSLGGIHQTREEWQDAEQWYRRAIESDSRHSAAMHNLVAVLKRQGRVAAAVDLLEVYVARRPGDAKMHHELGLIYARDGRMELARTQFALAVEIAPDDVAARNNLALALAQLGRHNEARSHLEMVVLQQPDNANAHVNLGVLLENAGELAAARDHFAAALKFNPDDQEARQRLQALEKRLSPR